LAQIQPSDVLDRGAALNHDAELASCVLGSLQRSTSGPTNTRSPRSGKKASNSRVRDENKNKEHWYGINYRKAKQQTSNDHILVYTTQSVTAVCTERKNSEEHLIRMVAMV